MKRKMAIALTLCLGLISACAGGKPVQEDCGTILRSRCTACHDVDWVCNKLGARSRDRWLATIDRMVQHGAELTVSEKTALLDCLVLQPQKVTALCTAMAGQGAKN